MLPPHLERIREKLAENIHELWVMNKIELGWTYGMVSYSKIDRLEIKKYFLFLSVHVFVFMEMLCYYNGTEIQGVSAGLKMNTAQTESE